MSPRNDTASQQFTLNCRMAQEPAALERLCRVVRVRGFRISKMAMEATGDVLDIALTLEGSRPVAMLKAQLEKLQTVAGVELVGTTMARSRTA
ncbi:ACT domain-containing protein [Marinobacter sp. C2H3]|uniref:ACT domain-containing protein n=1 Tax=Marinobacter sp. C2H3 TaxID=3119003 RepID=UPI00300EEB96